MRVKEINVGLGISIELNGIWYRPNAGITLEVDIADSKELRLKAYQQAFSEIKEQIEKEIEELTK